ncbi:MAG TPA: xanthine dehydrogenase accessory protein XdhC [Pseudomonadales bacterium]|nr:xanthine dehydrogenase accessory protein XdhC [Pseudomonadales bacterium]
MSTGRWDEAIVDCRSRQQPCVLVTVLGTSGSTPRDPGTKMVVTGEATFDTIGGGGLERLVTEAARTLLADADAPQQLVKHFPLGQEAKQCCGGAVAVLLEQIRPALTGVALFGAGHVASALVTILAELPIHLTWIDSRAELFDRPEAPNRVIVHAEDPEAFVADLPPGTPALVMTHDHDLDLRLVTALLRRQEPAFVGLIGSTIKAQRFRMRLAAAGLERQADAYLHSPVGLAGIPGKEPMAIAVAIAGQLLQLVAGGAADTTAEEPDRSPGRQAGLRWPELRPLLDVASKTPRDSGHGAS